MTSASFRLLALCLATAGCPKGNPTPAPAEEVAPRLVEVAADLQGTMGARATVIGLLERRAPDGIASPGTAVVLADGTAVYVSEGDPPAGWDWLIGTRVRVQGRVWARAPEGWAAPKLADFEVPMPADVGMPTFDASGP